MCCVLRAISMQHERARSVLVIWNRPNRVVNEPGLISGALFPKELWPSFRNLLKEKITMLVIEMLKKHMGQDDWMVSILDLFLPLGRHHGQLHHFWFHKGYVQIVQAIPSHISGQSMGSPKACQLTQLGWVSTVFASSFCSFSNHGERYCTPWHPL